MAGNDFNPYAYANQPDATEGVATGINQGVDWAQKQFALDTQRQQVQSQMDEHAEMKRQFNVKQGTQIYDTAKRITQMQSSPTKNAAIKQFQASQEQMGMPLSPELSASLNDDTLKNDYAQVFSLGGNVKVSNPDAFNSAMANLVGTLPQEDVSGWLNKTQQGFSMLQAATTKAQSAQSVANTNLTGTEYKADAMGGARQNTIDNRNQNTALANYNAQVKPVAFQLDSIGKLQNIFDQIDSGKIKSTSQVAGLISMEEARIAAGKSNFGEGTAASLAITSYEGQLKNLKNKLLDSPGDTISPENLEQAKNIYAEMRGALMQQHDRAANTAMAGLPAIGQAAIRARGTAFQQQYAKKFGTWDGPGLEDQTSVSPVRGGGGVNITPPDQSQAGGQTDQSQQQSPQQQPSQPAPQAPKQLDQGQLQAAQTLKSRLQSIPAGPGRNAIIQKIQSSIPLEIRQKVGLP